MPGNKSVPAYVDSVAPTLLYSLSICSWATLSSHKIMKLCHIVVVSVTPNQRLNEQTWPTSIHCLHMSKWPFYLDMFENATVVNCRKIRVMVPEYKRTIQLLQKYIIKDKDKEKILWSCENNSLSISIYVEHNERGMSKVKLQISQYTSSLIRRYSVHNNIDIYLSTNSEDFDKISWNLHCLQRLFLKISVIT